MDTFDILASAHQHPDVQNKLAMLTRMSEIFSGLAQSFPSNATFKSQLEAIQLAKAIFEGLAANSETDDAEIAARTAEAHAIFKAAGAKDVDLAQWGFEG